MSIGRIRWDINDALTRLECGAYKIGGDRSASKDRYMVEDHIRELDQENSRLNSVISGYSVRTSLRQVMNFGAEAELAAWLFQNDETGISPVLVNDGINTIDSFLKMNPRLRYIGPLYTTPTKPGHMVVPERITRGWKDDQTWRNDDYVKGWNECREAMLNATQGGKGEGE